MVGRWLRDVRVPLDHLLRFHERLDHCTISYIHCVFFAFDMGHDAACMTHVALCIMRDASFMMQHEFGIFHCSSARMLILRTVNHHERRVMHDAACRMQHSDAS